MSKAKKNTGKAVETIRHADASRRNIPTAEYESVMADQDRDPIMVAYERRNADLDPQLVWRGKDMETWSDLVAPAPPLFIQEKVHPKALIDDLVSRTEAAAGENFEQIDLFADFNGLPDEVSRTEFYAHDANWTNRMILGDSLQVMASLAERERLRGEVQCIYFDPPYGIKFNSNFQWSTTSRDVKDGKVEHITREPEQVRAFRDTWKDGIHSYLTYLRDRLTVAQDLLTTSGSIFVQISDENVHLVRSLLDEVFGAENFISLITFVTTSGFTQATALPRNGDYLLWYAKSADSVKVRPLWTYAPDRKGYRWLAVDGEQRSMTAAEEAGDAPLPDGAFVYKAGDIGSQGAANAPQPFDYRGRTYQPPNNSHWKANYPNGMERLARAGRVHVARNSIQYRRGVEDFPYRVRTNLWTDTGTGNFTDEKIFVVQTSSKVIERCVLLTTDPGDLVLDPTCGSGTTAYVAEQWGRRWITIDTSRVALALARARIMGARYPYYLLRDSPAGQAKEAELHDDPASVGPTGGDVRHGFVLETVPHIKLEAIANNLEIDVIWERWQPLTGQALAALNAAAGETWTEWEVPTPMPPDSPDELRRLHSEWRDARAQMQAEIDDSIASKGEREKLYDRPYEDPKTVRVAGPFTVDSLSPHRLASFDEDDRLIEAGRDDSFSGADDFADMVLANLTTAGVQQAHKDAKLDFVSVSPWPGKLICGEGIYREGSEDAAEKRAGIFVGPEFGTVSRADLVEAAREAGDAGFDALVACAFNYEARASEFNQLGRIPVLKARMNADLHMSEELKNTGKGNLFVIFGEPDIEILDADSAEAKAGQIQVHIKGVDVFDPSTGEIRSDDADGIACWFVDTDYNEESFFVRQAYFLGANDPYRALRTTLKAEIDPDAWASLHSDTSRPFDKPGSGRIAVKVINHLGDEAMKVLRVA
ncbi:MAG TPA: site-specific DNA-methyltransferase [Solirubrobacteraceae bacterium]|nr:site-specific DNA-methyltransferase [Solirubrobacteraceae bacterium]